jgi:hypothetical protein
MRYKPGHREEFHTWDQYVERRIEVPSFDPEGVVVALDDHRWHSSRATADKQPSKTGEAMRRSHSIVRADLPAARVRTSLVADTAPYNKHTSIGRAANSEP